MENKVKKNSINTVIYLLLAAMVLSVILVSVFTVASRRETEGKETLVPESDGAITSGTEDKGTAVTVPDTAVTDSLPENTEKAPETAKPSADTQSGADIQASVGEDIRTSVEKRYFVIPLAGTAAKAFEIDIPVYSMTMNDYRAHTGVDIAAPLGTEVVSASAGTVCRIWNDQLMGRCVSIDHGDSIYTTYMNMAEESASQYKVGDRVAMGQVIGAVGESALIEIAEEPHLHLEMKVNGNYVDPLEYMGIASVQETVYED